VLRLVWSAGEAGSGAVIAGWSLSGVEECSGGGKMFIYLALGRDWEWCEGTMCGFSSSGEC
jgi:hypothetical protein